MPFGLGDQMLAAAEAALQAHLVDLVEQCAQVGWRRRTEIEREPRQQRLEQRGLSRFKRVALAAAEEGAASLSCGLGHCANIKDANGRHKLALPPAVGSKRKWPAQAGHRAEVC